MGNDVKRHFSGPGADLHELQHKMRCRAEADVRDGFRPNLEGLGAATFLMQIVCLPSLSGSRIGWGLYRCSPESGDSPTYIGTRTEWRADVDFERLRTPIDLVRCRVTGIDPTVSRREVEVDPAIVEDAWARISAVGFPLQSSPGEITLDGVAYELNLGEYLAGTTIRWWCDGPAEWQPLTKPVMALYEALEKQYAEQSNGT